MNLDSVEKSTHENRPMRYLMSSNRERKREREIRTQALEEITEKENNEEADQTDPMGLNSGARGEGDLAPKRRSD